MAETAPMTSSDSHSHPVPFHFRKAPAPSVQMSDKNSIRLEAEKKRIQGTCSGKLDKKVAI